ncbi:MAG: hypothetical protein P8075_19340 [Deltaproteobacteria bacterium]|jgi:hypothetical protein
MSRVLKGTFYLADGRACLTVIAQGAEKANGERKFVPGQFLGSKPLEILK